MLIKIISFINNPLNRFANLSSLGFFNHMSDEKYLKKIWKSIFGKELDLNTPKTFNEKMQWLKLYDRNPLYATLVDKYKVKKYVADIIGEKYIIPTYGVWENFDDIDFDKLPEQFVIKCTHDSGGIVIVKDRLKFDKKLAKRKIEKSLKRNYYLPFREWPYKNVKPSILVEKYMEDDNIKDIRDYKFFCFNGEPKVMYISDCSHTKDQKIIFYDNTFTELDISRSDYKNFDEKPIKPTQFEKMLELSSKLSQGIPHVRVDWYEINNQLYFGEMTFHTGAGYIPFTKKEYDYELGSYIHLPMSRDAKSVN